MAGYLNRDGGWAAATQGVSAMMSRVTALGGTILSDKGVSKLIREDGKTTGVLCSDGTTFNADMVILATGSWTASAFPELNLNSNFVSTG